MNKRLKRKFRIMRRDERPRSRYTLLPDKCGCVMLHLIGRLNLSLTGLLMRRGENKARPLGDRVQGPV